MSDRNIEVISEDQPLTKAFWNGDRKPANQMVSFFSDCKAVIKIDGQVYTLLIKKGFSSDGGTIPRITGWLRGLATTPYYFHDWLYTNCMFDRETCDQILIALLKFDGVSDVDCDQIYAGVRVFGESHYGDSDSDGTE